MHQIGQWVWMGVVEVEGLLPRVGVGGTGVDLGIKEEQ